MNSIARARARSAVHEEFVGGPFRLKWLAWAGLALLGGVALGAIALSLLVMLTRPADAADALEQQSYPPCLPLADMRATLLKDYGEVELSGGMIGEQALMIVFATPDGSSWTAIVLGVNGQACALAGGQNWTQIGIETRESF